MVLKVGIASGELHALDAKEVRADWSEVGCSAELGEKAELVWSERA